MAKILVISSWVSCGHVGASAAQPVLQALHHEVIVLPTVILSTHYGFGRVVAQAVEVGRIADIVNALMDNGLLDGLDAVLTGYMPSPTHIDTVAAYLPVLRGIAPGLRIVVDPVMGDRDSGLYVAQDVAEAMGDRLVPLADVITPNAFEWERLGAPDGVIVTSVGRTPGETGVFDAGQGLLYPVPQRQGVPKGTGDVFSALIAAGQPVARAVGQLDALIAASLGAPHLAIAQSATTWTTAAPVKGVAHGL